MPMEYHIVSNFSSVQILFGRPHKDTLIYIKKDLISLHENNKGFKKVNLIINNIFDTK